MLKKQHYETIAKIIEVNRDSRPDDYDNGYCDATSDIARKLADYFATDNPKFDHTKFMIACGLD